MKLIPNVICLVISLAYSGVISALGSTESISDELVKVVTHLDARYRLMKHTEGTEREGGDCLAVLWDELMVVIWHLVKETYRGWSSCKEAARGRHTGGTRAARGRRVAWHLDEAGSI